MLPIGMSQKPCPYCKQKFQPSRYRPDQKVCSSLDCQRRRRKDYHRKKLAEDTVYREQCRDSQRKWREKNPAYMQTYRAGLRGKDRPTGTKSGLLRELRQLLKLAKNNVALDLKSIDASVWFVCRKGAVSEKNNLASTKVIIVQGVPRHTIQKPRL